MIKRVLQTGVLSAILIATMSFKSMNEYTLTVKVKGCNNLNGQIALALYNNENQYTDNPWKSFNENKSGAIDSVVIFVLKNIKQGKYAITFLDDENSNKKMDYSFFGIPQEGYGFSNNVKPGFLIAPKYEKCTFDLTADKEIILYVQYW